MGFTVNNCAVNDIDISKTKHQFILGDCLSELGKINDKSIDIVLCDLPYGITNNKFDKELIPFDLLWNQYERIIRDKGVIMLTSSSIFTAKVMLSNENLYKYKWIFVKSKSTGFLLANKQPLRKYEEVCVFYKKQPEYNPIKSFGKPYNRGIRKNKYVNSYNHFNDILCESKDGSRYPNDIIYFKTAESEKSKYGNFIHPTQKLVELARYLLRTYYPKIENNQNPVLLDNCFGSGSFLIAGLLENYDTIGIELNKQYYDDFISRWNYVLNKYELKNIDFQCK